MADNGSPGHQPLNELFPPAPGPGIQDALSIQDPVQFQQQINALNNVQPGVVTDNVPHHAPFDVGAPNFVDNLNEHFPPAPGPGILDALSIQDPVQFQQQINALNNVQPGVVTDNSPHHAPLDLAAPNFVDKLNELFPPALGPGIQDALSIQDPVRFQQQINALNNVQPGNVDAETEDVADPASPPSQ